VFGALAAHLDFKDEHQVEFTGFKHGHEKEYLELLKPEDVVYFIDVCPSEEFLLKSCATAEEVYILDHHKTGIDTMNGIYEKGIRPDNLHDITDIKKSGATIALEFFSPMHIAGNETKEAYYKYRELFELVEDNDLFLHNLPDSVAFYQGLFGLELEYDFQKNPGIFDSLMALNKDELIASGKLLIEARDHKIATLLVSSIILTIPNSELFLFLLSFFLIVQSLFSLVDGSTVPCYAIESNDFKIVSELGKQLATISKSDGEIPMAMIYYEREGKMSVSFRSIDDYDTTMFSKKYGGGGHKGASGCSIDLDEFEKFKVR
jgi:oligoribonuclease NrnB/cAMP/cGMP phosphodiesterase (DHH superfamily)